MFAAGKTSTSAAAQLYVDDVFSTYLYTGNGSTQTITNGIDLAGKGGLLWIKCRSVASSHALVDTARGSSKSLRTDFDNGQNTSGGTNDITSFTSSGFTLGPNSATAANANSATHVSWTFRKAPKFFDVVTYTGTGANRTIAHSLGQVPGMIVVKRTDTTGNWEVYHRSLANTEYAVINSTAAKATDATMWNSTTPTASVFSLGTNTNVNASGGTYVAYLFSHDTATDGMILCGSYTGNGSTTGPIVTLGWEPQWLLIKRTDAGAGGWNLFDVMRGIATGGVDAGLQANNSISEASFGSFNLVDLNATGFQLVINDSEVNLSGATYIYVAIRRPNKPPTTGTQVFSPDANTTVTGTKYTTGFAIDLQIGNLRSSGAHEVYDRLRGISTNSSTNVTAKLVTNTTAAEVAGSNGTLGWDNTGFLGSGYWNGLSNVYWNFRRAPGVFDVVCYTGVGGQLVSHNLGVPPELRIIKKRSATSDWAVIYGLEKNAVTVGDKLVGSLNATATLSASNPTITPPNPSTKFSTYYSTPSYIDDSGATYVAYLFATSPGISKVFSYTGNGSSQTINCGFTTGARFVLIKRTDSTGDWYVWDTARGIIAANDPHLSLNTGSAEVTTNDSIDTDSTGFIVNQLAATNINVNTATYIGLAFA